MVWLIAWLIAMFSAIATMGTSGTELGVAIGEPNGSVGSGTSNDVFDSRCDREPGLAGGDVGAVSPGSPGIMTGEPSPSAPPPIQPTGNPEAPIAELRCVAVISPDDPVSTTPGGVVTSPPTDGVLMPPGGGDFPSIEPGVPEPEGDRMLKSPPIEGLDLVIREIWPPQYVALVTSALPDGCSEFAGYTVEREGTTITIEVWNSVPTGLVPCNMMYGYHPFSVELGSAFESGVEYTLVVGERELTFIAQ